jgi:hypothetical protein
VGWWILRLDLSFIFLTYILTCNHWEWISITIKKGLLQYYVPIYLGVYYRIGPQPAGTRSTCRLISSYMYVAYVDSTYVPVILKYQFIVLMQPQSVNINTNKLLLYKFIAILLASYVVGIPTTVLKLHVELRS